MVFFSFLDFRTFSAYKRNLKNTPGHFVLITDPKNVYNTYSTLQTSSATAIHPDEVFVETDASKKEITQEYDPAKPNDYSVVNALIQKRKREKKYEEEVYLIIDGH